MLGTDVCDRMQLPDDRTEEMDWRECLADGIEAAQHAGKLAYDDLRIQRDQRKLFIIRAINRMQDALEMVP